MNIKKIWIKKHFNVEIINKIKEELKISFDLAKLLNIRGINNVEEAFSFLYPSLKDLIDPKNFKDMDKASLRLIKAILEGETIGIFGDYDVDGVSSCALMCDFLKNLNAKVIYTLPNRLKEGYGLSINGVDRLKEAKVIVTVDCGVTAFNEIEYANSLGIDVLVIDHHTAKENLPKAFALVNPKRLDCESKAVYLCAAGVVFFLCIEIRRKLRGINYFKNKTEPDLKDLLDLVSLATVADVVPLFKENRVLVKHGLQKIKEGKRPGIKALLKAASIMEEKVTSTNLGFYLGPRINAAGRLEDAQSALELLLSQDFKKCFDLAFELEHINQERKDLEKRTLEEALKLIEIENLAKYHVLVVYHEEFHPGVVGIVASRVVELFHKPAIIIGQNGKGSGRSITGFDLYEEVLKVGHTLKNFGGHAHAIGVSLLDNNINIFRDTLQESVDKNIDLNIFEKKIYYDDEVLIKDLNFSLEAEIKKLEPFGAKNPHPVFRINQVFLKNLKRLNGGHIKGEIESKDGVIAFIGFRMDISDDFSNKKLDVLGVLDENEWQGNIFLQLRLIDFKESLSTGC